MQRQTGKFISIILAFVFLVVCPVAYASPLESVMETLLVTKDDAGKEVLKKTDSALPGEIVEYRTTYKNLGNSTLTGLIVEVPIPGNTDYVSGTSQSQTPHDLVVSIDGGRSWDSEPVKRLRKGPDGVKKEVIVGPEEYTHLRWITKKPIHAGEVQVYRCRVEIR